MHRKTNWYTHNEHWNKCISNFLFSMFVLNFNVRFKQWSNFFVCVVPMHKIQKWKLHTKFPIDLDGFFQHVSQKNTTNQFTGYCSYLFQSISAHAFNKIGIFHIARLIYNLHSFMLAYANMHTQIRTYIQYDRVRTTMNEIIVRHRRQYHKVRHFGGELWAKMPNKVPNLNFKANF